MLAFGLTLLVAGLIAIGILASKSFGNMRSMARGDVEAGFDQHLKLMKYMFPAGIVTILGVVFTIIGLVRG